MANVIVKESGIHGLDVFASRAFAAGEVVHTLDDSRLVNADHLLHPELGEDDHHCDYLAGGKVILQPFPERHINSSCDPNTYVKTIDGVRHVIARRGIRSGEEITYDYIINCHGGEEWKCRCGSERCRGMIPSSFFELLVEKQAEYWPLLGEWFIEEHEEKIGELRVRTDA